MFDATGIESSEELAQAWEFLHPTIRRLLGSGRVIVPGTPPEDCSAPTQAIAEVLARDGAHVVGLDVPAMSVELTAGMAGIGGSVLATDITAESAPGEIATHLLEFHGGVNVVVHNAGVTRDKTLGRMTEDLWSTVIDINLIAPQRIDRELFERDAVHSNGRIVCVSSISGIAGNAGQTHYSTAKAGVIGIGQEWAPALGQRGVTINAVAPGFIETQMTAAMPIALREAGRLMNSLSQGGLPVVSPRRSPGTPVRRRAASLATSSACAARV